MNTTNSSLFSEVKYYLKLRQEIMSRLLKDPDDWAKFQEIFNLTLDKLYRDIMIFEKKNITKSESKVYKLKKIFATRYRRYFLYGEFIRWSYNKPFGYSGDFKIIDEIYKNNTRTSGFDRLWDNYFQQLAMPISIRERKEDFKKIILNFIKNKQNRQIRIMDLASGPAREIKELLEVKPAGLFRDVIFDCYDLDVNAIDYARKLIGEVNNVNFFRKNAIRLALRKDIRMDIENKYDLIYSTGLFDYLDEKVAILLLANLKKLIKPNGLIVISNAADKYNNLSASWMEWVAEWYLIYRSSDEFKKIFTDAGFSNKTLEVILQNTKVMQYCFAKID